MKHTHIIIAALLLAPIAALSAADAPKHPSKPNIIFILADDLGFETLGCYGGKTYQPPFPRPPVRPNGCFRRLPPKANS